MTCMFFQARIIYAACLYDPSMDSREANLPADNNPTTSSSSSPPQFLRHVQAAFKRHRMMPQLNNIHPRRLVIPRRETSKSSGPTLEAESHDALVSQRVQDSIASTKNVTAVSLGEASASPNSITDTPAEGGNFGSIDHQKGQPTCRRGSNMVASTSSQHEHVPLDDGPKKVQGSDDHMDTGTDSLLIYMDSLALTETEDISTAPCQDVKHQNFQNSEVDLTSRSNNPYRNFLQSDLGCHMTQSSVVGSSCATTTLVNSAYAPMLSSTTHCSRPSQQSSFQTGESFGVTNKPMTQVDMENPSESLAKHSSQKSPDKTTSQVPSAAVSSHFEKKHELSEDQRGKEAQECCMPKDPTPLADSSTKGHSFAGDITNLQSQAPISDDQTSNMKLVPPKVEKKEKASRKRSYDHEFFTVNGKYYQRLGKIGSGGSSEVHKVISHGCTIYALKNIKLKGRDHATAYGFCQEIEYLNKLRGKDHIIQLIDYEVTDEALFKAVMSGSKSNKEARVKEDGHIFMLLEYGEIDLAHMLSQKWKELDSSKSTIDENWLRFYWQQILLAVKTIHEERIVHSDLKPANFLLVKGSLKLIDFGIAKAIMSDTTNIQRDSQVGTLSYMSPEAFMCNETDADGNTIKCGRPSDIWSLGCILYQMVYGRTPFSEYTTFWAKFKVITDPNYEINYEPLSNPWLLDLMKKCLQWDQKKRWRIPQLLQHPFLVPQIPTPIRDQNCKFIQLVADSCTEDPKAMVMCSQLRQLLTEDEESTSLPQRLHEMSKICLQLKEQLANSQ